MNVALFDRMNSFNCCSYVEYILDNTNSLIWNQGYSYDLDSATYALVSFFFLSKAVFSLLVSSCEDFEWVNKPLLQPLVGPTLLLPCFYIISFFSWALCCRFLFIWFCCCLDWCLIKWATEYFGVSVVTWRFIPQNIFNISFTRSSYSLDTIVIIFVARHTS